MHRLRIPVAVVLSLAVAAPALASFGGGSDPPAPPAPSTSSNPMQQNQSAMPRQEAEQTYALGYEEVAKAKKDLADGKAKNAEKKLKRALERGERAVALDARYHEAWNLVGYCARKLGDYDKAFAAYEKCLGLKPDYAPAREYLGEAWLDRGDPKKAREQLVLLEKFGAAGESADLKSQIEAWEAAHPASALADSLGAPADSAAAPASGTP